MVKKLLQAAALLTAFSGAAHATTFDFSYVFTDGQTLSGTLDGTLNGTLVTNIANVTLSFNGNTFVGPIYAGTYDATTQSYDYSPNAAVLSTNAAYNNFIFADAPDAKGNGVTNYFYFVSGSVPSGSGTQEVLVNNTNTGDIDYDNPAGGKWTVSAVPIPGALPLMVSGLGLLAAARRRRREESRA